MRSLVLSFSLVISALVCSNVAHAQPGIINTIAGDTVFGFSGDGGLATDAIFRAPAGLAIDNYGNIYIADYGNNRIRMISYGTGVITTIAGSDTADSFSGDDGLAIAAHLFHPNSIALDTFGNVFFSDQNNNRIRKINASTGIITTVAGNGTKGYSGDGVPATATGLYYPAGITFDVAGDLYIADWYNNRIRKVTMSTGIITTIAGTGIAGYSGDHGPATAADFYIPSDLAFDYSGNLFISEYGNSTVRKITASTGIITTIAGNGIQGFRGDGHSSITAMLNRPLAVKTDSAGNVYIADWKNYRVRMISASTGIINTIAGNGIYGYDGDGGPATTAQMTDVDGIALDAGANLYIADEFNSVIREVECPTCFPVSVVTIQNRTIEGIYPNPASKLLTVTAANIITQVSIINLIGQKVYDNYYNSEKIQVDVSGLPAGMYLIRINGTEVRKFVKE